MIFQCGLLMGNLDTCLHILGIEILVILGIVLPFIEEKSLKRVISNLFVLLLGLMLAHAVTHLLPNAIARFIYGSHHSFYSKQTFT